MTSAPDLSDLWRRLKHGKLSEEEVVACERLLENPAAQDIHLALLIVGMSRPPTERLARIVAAYLRNGKTEEERYSALRTLCGYWGMWQEYLPYLYSKMDEASWEDDYALADEATQLTGRYLLQHGTDKRTWGKLLEVYDAAVARNDAAAAGIAKSAMAVALAGPAEALRMQLRKHPEDDASIVLRARERASVT